MDIVTALCIGFLGLVFGGMVILHDRVWHSRIQDRDKCIIEIIRHSRFEIDRWQSITNMIGSSMEEAEDSAGEGGGGKSRGERGQ